MGNVDATPVESIVDAMMADVVIPFANLIVGSIPATSIDLGALQLDTGVVLGLDPRGGFAVVQGLSEFPASRWVTSSN